MRTELTKEDALRFFALMTMEGDFSLDACFDRAYRDFCRTLTGIGKRYDSITIRKSASDHLLNFFKIIIQHDLNEDDFDKLHKQTCDSIIQFYADKNEKFNVGQAQKWINMSCKYVYCLYLADLLQCDVAVTNNLQSNYKHFHMPIDNIVLKNKEVKKQFNHFIHPRVAWSRINDYTQYINLQKELRKFFRIPLIVVESQIWK